LPRRDRRGNVARHGGPPSPTVSPWLLEIDPRARASMTWPARWQHAAGLRSSWQCASVCLTEPCAAGWTAAALAARTRSQSRRLWVWFSARLGASPLLLW